ncbi:uncharacterized protein LOC142350331 [Convolutriloba macropyga]|uniref:uncharacterized protein LOC142350331 n=1 Tax=Convolutriloba macropyga TaxID=536237 RepID=UPI003F51D95B
MKLRDDLENIVNYEEMAKRPDANPLQALVAQRFMEWKFPTIVKKAESRKARAESDSESELPAIARPEPELYSNLERYVHLNSLRWVDLFTRIDREKSWELDENNIKNLLDSIGAKVAKSDVQDFVSYFDLKGNGKLTYKDLMTKRHLLSSKKSQPQRAERNKPENTNKAKTRNFKYGRNQKISQPYRYQDRNNFRNSNEKLSKIAGEKSQKLMSRKDCQNWIDDRNVAVFAAYEDDPNLYKMKLLRLQDLQKDPIKKSRKIDIKQNLKSESGNFSGNFSRNNSQNTNIRVQNDDFTSEIRENLSRPLYKKLPRKLLPIEKTALNTDRLSPPKHDKNEVENVKFVSKSSRPNDQIIKQTEENTEQEENSLEPKRLRELTFTSLKSAENSRAKNLHLEFRKRCWQEFEKIQHLFEANNLVMSEKALERALLFPRERTSSQLKKHVKNPRDPNIPEELLKKHKQQSDSTESIPGRSKSKFTNPGYNNSGYNLLTNRDPSGFYYPPKTASDIESIDYKLTKPTKTGQHFNPYYLYPKQKRPSTFGGVENLSTGTSFVKPKTDCWMTFDEYMRFCERIKPREQFISEPNPDAFWPGYMLEKLAIAFTGREKSSDSIFQPINKK